MRKQETVYILTEIDWDIEVRTAEFYFTLISDFQLWTKKLLETKILTPF